MADDSPGFFRSLRGLATDWVQTKRKNLQAKPQTQVGSAGGIGQYEFGGQEIDQQELKDVKAMRESGGIISQVYHSKALIKFGTGAELQAEDDDLQQALNEELFSDLESLVLDIGEDAIWYPYSVGEIVETRTGDFSHIELIEPWTMLPQTDEYGDIIAWEQKISGHTAEAFDPEEIGHIIINKASGRDKTGISEVLRSKEEIETFKSNQNAMREATERLGFPFIHAKAGREGATQLNDNELRRIRNRLAEIGPGETQVTGPDVDIEQMEPATVDFGEIQTRDMKMLATASGLPIELLNEGSDGLGSGMPAELRKELLALRNEADRRKVADQFVNEFVKPVVREYTEFDHTQDITMQIDPFLDDKQDMASLIQSVGGYLKANEARDMIGKAPLDDEELGESFVTPEDEQSDEPEGGGGLFASDGRDTGFRHLQTPEGVPPNAQGPVQDKSDVPEGAQTFEGPQGGTYFLPSGEEAVTEDADVEERANPDGSIDVDRLQSGDTVLKGDDEVTIDGVEEDDIGTLVGFTDNDTGEEYMIYNDMLEDFSVPGVDGDEDTDDDTDGDTDDADAEFTAGDEVLSPTGEPATITAYDAETNTVAYETEDGEEMFSTVEGLESTEVENETDANTQRVLDEVDLPDNVSVGVENMDESRVESTINGLNEFDEAVGIGDADLFTIQDSPQDDVSEAAGAAYHTGQRSLYIKPDPVDEDTRQQEFEAGFLATETPEGSIHHEMMHAKHTQNVLQSDELDLDELREVDFDDDTAQLIEDEVSTYAATNATEFVAEVGSSIIERDASYSDEIMDLYDEYGGPEVGQ